MKYLKNLNVGNVQQKYRAAELTIADIKKSETCYLFCKCKQRTFATSRMI